MGNFAGKNKGLVHLVNQNERIDRTPSPNSLLRVKVRMTKSQLKELLAQVETNKLGHRNSEELAIAILQECLKGRLYARVVAAAESDHKTTKYERGWRLRTISEEEEEHQHLL